VNSEPLADTAAENPQHIAPEHISRLKLIGLLLTIFGIALFTYFVYTVGLDEILVNVSRFGIAGFAVILGIYFLRICLRGAAWKLCVYEPYKLSMRDTVPAVIIGEAMSSMIPLGILISGTSKAIAVRRRVPLVVGLSSIATENLFYSFTTSIFLMFGAITLLRTFPLDEGWALTVDVLVIILAVLVVLGIVMIIRQWHFASETCEWLYRRGVLSGLLEHGRMHVRLFENLIYGFYRRYPRRFLPVVLIESAFHTLGVVEVVFVLNRLTEGGVQIVPAFLLDSVPDNDRF
jgi:hypothetical protein